MSKLRRGFQASAVRLATSVRDELGLGHFEPLDPYKLAELYGVTVLGIEETGCSNAAVEHFAGASSTKFSGFVVRVGTRLTIIENRAHSTERRRSTVAHEMSHVLLEHDFSMLITSEHTWTARDGSVEGEANWLAAELLLPQKAAQRAAMRGTAPHLVASAYGVSIEIATWRMNISGGQTIARRAATKWLRS